jgi:hypothetical protein
VTLWVLGALSSAAFNISLARSGPFAAEGALAYLVWGMRSLAAPLALAAFAVVALWAARFVLRLTELWAPIATRVKKIQRRFVDAADRVGLNDPSVLAQALTACGIGALALFVWRFHELVEAWTTLTNSTTVANLAPLSPGNLEEKASYRQALTVLLLLMTAGLFRVLRLRHARQMRRGRGAVAALVAVTVGILLFAELPYRIMWQNAAPRATLGGERCYVIGDNGREFLMFCPDVSPPRNRVVGKTDPSLKLSGVVESIFTPAGR